MSEVETTAESPQAVDTTKKRKRDDAPATSLEIDVSLPEPPSKKALRKAKKQKTPHTVNNGETLSATKTQASPGNDSPTAGQEASTKPVPPTTTYSIWIGNLPFTATKAMLRTFLTTQSQPPILESAVTRIHVPAPRNAVSTKTTLKPQNKGFAYIDLADLGSFTAALALSEAQLGGRNVLIKDAKSFEGRPTQPADETSKNANGTVGKSNAKAPSRRVFVGNLGFDVTREDLREFYAPCGAVADVHMATFEDSGKCKGFAWVTFEAVGAAEAAVRGWLRVEQVAGAQKVAGDDEKGTEAGTDEAKGGSDSEVDQQKEDQQDTTRNKKQQMRKWFVNRLAGRAVRCEFAEDSSIRYKKRFGKDKPTPSGFTTNGEVSVNAADAPTEEVDNVEVKNERTRPAGTGNGIQPGAPTDPTKRRGRGTRELTDKDKRRAEEAKEIQEKTRYRSGAVAESTGSKVVFE